MISIRKSLSSGIFYTVLARYSGILISIFIGAILARLLSPEEFGIVALLTVFVNFFSLLSDFGIGPAIVQNQKLTKTDIESIFSFSLIIGVLMSFILVGISPLISLFYNNPKLTFISRLLSLSVLFNTFLIVPKALLEKELKFKQLGIITVIIQSVTGLVAICLAYYGFSYYTLVIQSILSGFILFVVFYWLNPLKISLKISLISIRKIYKFSVYQFFFNLINYFSRNSDNIFIGKFMDPVSLGYYDKSYRLMMMPVANLTHVITPVLMPVLSKFQNDKELVFNTYLKVIKILATIGFPLSAFLFFSADEIITLLYGTQWGASIPIFRLLATTIGIQMVLSSSGSIFQTVNRTDLMFITGLLGTIILAGSLLYAILFINKTLITVSYAIMAGYLVYFFIIFYFLIKIALKKKLYSFFKILFFPIIISITIAFTLWGFQQFYPENLVYSLITKVLISLSVFFCVFLIRKENRMLIKDWRNKWHGK